VNLSPLSTGYTKPPRKKKKKKAAAATEGPSPGADKIPREVPSSDLYFNPVVNNKRDISRPDEFKPDHHIQTSVCQSCKQPIVPQLSSLEDLELDSDSTNEAIEELKNQIVKMNLADDNRDWKSTCEEIAKNTSELISSCDSQLKTLNEIVTSVKKSKAPADKDIDLLNSDYFKIDPNHKTEAQIKHMMEETLKLELETEGPREVFYAGEFDHTYGLGKNKKTHKAREIPQFLKDEIDLLPVPPGHHKPNSVICNVYRTGKSGMGAHEDAEGDISPWGWIYNISGGVVRFIKFTRKGKPDQFFELTSGSLNMMTRALQNLYKHEIPADCSIEEIRISWTFRYINPAFLESSTLLLGDSQCHNIKFGSDKETLGSFCPGHRVNTYKAEHLEMEDTAFITSFKNVIISLGINNLRCHRSTINEPQQISDMIQRKCEDILKLNPRCRIGIATVLPTKTKELNVKVSELNRLLAIAVLKLNGTSSVSLIDLSFMTSGVNGQLKDSFSQANDNIHVSEIGTKVLGCRFKRFIRDIPLFQFLKRRKKTPASKKVTADPAPAL